MKFIDFHFKKQTLISVIMLIITVIYINIFHISEILENTFLENIQLFILIAGLILSVRQSKLNYCKILFNCLSLFIILLFLREISYGRIFYGHIPGGAPDEIYPLRHYKYGFLCPCIVGIYIILCSIYAVINKIWIDIINIIKSVKFPVYDFLICVICLILQLLGEHSDLTIVEETAEAIIYSEITAFILIYSKK